MWQLRVVCISVMANMLNSLLCAHLLSIYPLWQSVHTCFCPIFNWVVCFFPCWFCVLFAYSPCKSFVRYLQSKYHPFTQLIVCLFIQTVIQRTKVLNVFFYSAFFFSSFSFFLELLTLYLRCFIEHSAFRQRGVLLS